MQDFTFLKLSPALKVTALQIFLDVGIEIVQMFYCGCKSHSNQALQSRLEFVDSISRDGLDMHIYVIHYKWPKISD